MIRVSLTFACLASRLNSCRLWCFRGKVELALLRNVTKEVRVRVYREEFVREWAERELSESRRRKDSREKYLWAAFSFDAPARVHGGRPENSIRSLGEMNARHMFARLLIWMVHLPTLRLSLPCFTSWSADTEKWRYQSRNFCSQKLSDASPSRTLDGVLCLAQTV